MMKLLKFSMKERYKSGGVLVLFVFMFLTAFPQGGKHYTLDQLVHSAYVNYPFAKQLNLTKLQNLESVKSIGTEWLPQVSVSAKTTFQSEVYALRMPESVVQEFGLDFDPAKKLQYQGQAGVSQLIYDGGICNIKKKQMIVDGEIQSDRIKLSMLQVEDLVNTLFESILVNREQIKIIQFRRNDLLLRKKDIACAIQNGIFLHTDLQEIDADLIQLKQQKMTLLMQQCQYCVQLSSYTRQTVDTTSVLDLPVVTHVENTGYANRPDYRVFGEQLQSTDYQLKQLNREVLPRISIFANGYYGRPGLNVMDYSTHLSGIIGLSLTWNVAALYDNNHKKKMVKLDRELVENRRSVYEMDMNKQIRNLKTDILKNKDLMNSDGDIVKIRSEVKDVAASQLKNGSITLADYLIKLNDVSRALIDQSIHKIEYSMDKVKMRTLLNENN
jgi:outer membrane protein TolC